MTTKQTNYSDIAAAYNQSATTKSSTAGNRNISSVLSQIQDDGPAYINSPVNSAMDKRPHSDAPSHKHDNLINLRSDEISKAAEYKSQPSYNNKQQPDLPTATATMSKKDSISQRAMDGGASMSRTDGISQRAMDGGASMGSIFQRVMNGRNTATSTKALNKAKAAWMPIALLSFLVVFTLFYLFRIDARTNQLEVTLNALDKEVLNTVDAYTSELSPKVSSLKASLKEVRQDISLIKANTAIGLKPNNLMQTEVAQHAVINDNISILEDEILTLKNELKIANDKLKNISNQAVEKNSGVPAPTTIAAITAVTTIGWVANIASFRNKNQASQALAPLYAVGLSPMIQQANVNGNRIYRLIVDGFDSKAEARSFVRRADHEFGLPGGWVRKS